MKKIELKCSRCGAIMNLSDDHTKASCPYCKNHFLIKKELSVEELAEKAEKLSYARETGERKAIEDSIKRKMINKMTVAILIIIIVSIITMISLFVKYFSLELMNDPFKCIHVDFTGTDGSGSAVVVNANTCEEYSDITYIISKDSNLSEGDKITVTATSDIYRFDDSSKDYIVNGLALYLNDLKDLTDEMLNKLHESSYEYLINNLGITFSGEIVSINPYKLFLHTNGRDTNTLYDVQKISIKTKSGNVYEKFIVAYYENFVILNNESLYSYSRLHNCGNIILAGSPTEYSAISKDYAGNITGFNSIADFKNYLNKNNDGSFKVTER